MNPTNKRHIALRLSNKALGEFRAADDTLWLYDAIATDEEEAYWMGGVAPRDFIAALRAIDGPVTLRINSPGGSVFGAQAMVAAMREHPHPITARIDSLAASAASIIACEASQTVMSPGSYLMIHKAWGLMVGNADDFLDYATFLEKMDGELAKTYARKAGDEDHEPWMALMSAETWMTAEEAVEARLSDSVAEANTQRPLAQWDLSAYAKSPEIAGHDTDTEQRAARCRQVAARAVLHRI